MDFQSFWERLLQALKQNQAGLYLTVSFHLILLIIFLSYSINSLVQAETSFVFDFTGVEQQEEIKRLEEMKKSVAQEIDALLSGSSSSSAQVRNVAVNMQDRSGERLKDDRSKNPSEVYDQARELQEKLNASRREALRELDSEEDVAIHEEEVSTQTEKYTGASVVSWRLDKREARWLPAPAYKCPGAGDVTVAIVVNHKGYVTTARIIDEVSSSDDCLREFAIKAAKKSRFNGVGNDQKGSIPERQAGEIVYRFIAQ